MVYGRGYPLKQRWQALEGHHRLRLRCPHHDEQRTLDLGDMLQDVVFLLGTILLKEDLSRDQEGDGIDGVDQGLRMARVNMLLRLGSDLLEGLSWLDGCVSRIGEPGGEPATTHVTRGSPCVAM